MDIHIKDITDYIELLAPLHYAESFDNVGLLIGDSKAKVTGVLVTLDTLENVVDEAIANNCNLIVSFHPIIFTGLKKINTTNYVERTVTKAIKNDIAIYAIHTALDNCFKGVSAKMAEMLGLESLKILTPKSGLIKKLSVYVPEKQSDAVRNALFSAGAGSIGNYEDCSYNLKGLGTFKGKENSNPTKGIPGELVQEVEVLTTVIFEKHLESNIIQKLKEVHPYEEIAYEIVTTNNSHQRIGMGMIGELNPKMNENDFLQSIKETFKTGMIRHSGMLGKNIHKVAVLGGSGSFAIENAKKMGADVYVSADFKYHDFFKAENKILLVDIGHYESEQYTKNLMVDYLTKKIP